MQSIAQTCDPRQLAYFTAKDGQMTISAQIGFDDGSCEVSIPVEGEFAMTSFNPLFVLAAVKRMRSASVKMLWSGNLLPMSLQSGHDRRALIMPLRM